MSAVKRRTEQVQSPVYDPGAYPPFAVTVDIVVLTIDADGNLAVVLIQRDEPPFQYAWALPGGFVRPDETLDAAAARELNEESGIDAAAHLEQFGAYGEPDRDPRMRVVSIGYLAVLRDVAGLRAGSDAAEAQLIAVADVLTTKQYQLAFDHHRILTDAIERLRTKLELTPLAAAFIGPTFTLTDLRRVYESTWQTRLDPGNFRRKVLATQGFVESTGAIAPPGPEGGKPAEIYRVGQPVDDRLAAPMWQPRNRNEPVKDE